MGAMAGASFLKICILCNFGDICQKPTKNNFNSGGVYRYHTHTHNTQWLSRVVKKKKYKYLSKNNITIFKSQNFTAMDK